MSPTSFRRLHAWILARITVMCCGVSILTISTATTTGYVLEWTRLYQWTDAAVGMAPNTALALQATGVALVVIALSNRVWKCLT